VAYLDVHAAVNIGERKGKDFPSVAEASCFHLFTYQPFFTIFIPRICVCAFDLNFLLKISPFLPFKR
jgi:hypothetical protein